MESYFFVPATKLHKLEAINSLGIDHVIIDFEDAVLEEDRERLMREVKELPDISSYWFRVPIRENFEEAEPDSNLANELLELGVMKLIIPKLISRDDFASFCSSLISHKDLNLILLIEHPRVLIEMPQILQDPRFGKNIFGIALGSHDLMTQMGMEHTAENLTYPRIQTLYLAKAYNRNAIDIASMNIGKEVDFKEEISFAQKFNFNGKFLLHPRQLTWFEERTFSAPQIEWAEKILAALPPGSTGKNIEPFILEGQIIEKPHVERALTIMKKKYDNQ